MNVDDIHAAVIRRLALRQVHDPDFAGLCLLQRPIRSVLDVGANAGQSIVSLRVNFPMAAIDAFEANPMFHAALDDVAGRVGGPVTVHRCGLSDANGPVSLCIPHVGDEAFLEESSMLGMRYFRETPWVVQKYRERGGLRLVEVEAEMRVGDEFGFSPDIIKVDVEGAEVSVLRGLRETIRSCQPALLVENSDWHGVTALVDPLGYKPYRYDSLTRTLAPYWGHTTNTFYLAPVDQHAFNQSGDDVPSLFPGG